MTTETKLGLLLGMGVIILVGIFISDHLSKANSQQPAAFADSIQNGPIDEADLPLSLEESQRAGAGGDDTLVVDESRSQRTLPLPEDFEASPDPQPRNTRSQPNSTSDQRQQVARHEAEPQRETEHSPHITVQDLMIQGDREGRRVVDGDRRVADDRTPARGERVPEGFVEVGEEEVRPFDPDDVRGERERARVDARQQAQQEQRERERERERYSSDNDNREERVIHNVQENETLSKIAERYYGSTKHYKVIYEANRDSIPNPNFVRPGVRLVIPERAGSAQRQGGDSGSGQSRTTATTGDSAATRSYTVRERDTLSSIASRYFGSPGKWEELYEMNKDRIDNPDRLKVGTEILVPVR